MAIEPLVTVNGEWVNLYTATGITVGTALIVQNFSSRSPVAISDSSTEPTSTTGRVRLDETQFFQITSGSSGAWAYCSSIAKIAVQEG